MAETQRDITDLWVAVEVAGVEDGMPYPLLSVHWKEPDNPERHQVIEGDISIDTLVNLAAQAVAVLAELHTGKKPDDWRPEE